MVKLLYEKGADPLVPDSRVGVNAVHWAIHERRWDVVDFFKSKGLQSEKPTWMENAEMVVVDGKWSIVRPEGR